MCGSLSRGKIDLAFSAISLSRFSGGDPSSYLLNALILDTLVNEFATVHTRHANWFV